MSPKSQWLFYAIASGGCAALNGVFAKLTTTQLTTTWATGISHISGFKEPSSFVELFVRGVRAELQSDQQTKTFMLNEKRSSSSS